MRVIFTEIAEETYENVLNFLALHWTEREIDTFVNDTENLITQFKEGRIVQFRKSGFNTRSALVGKRHIRVFFIQRNKDLINILLFFDTRQDPRKVPKLLGVKKMKKLLILFTLYFSLVSFVERHPYHIGSVEINYNQKSKTYEVTGRFFMDDLENALNKKYNTSLHFGDAKFKAQLNDYLAKYSSEYFRLKSDNQFVKINYLGYEEDRESVEIYLESDKVKQPKKVETAVSFLYNYFDDQSNIVHIIVNGQRKSEKLSYPDRYLFQLF